MNLLATENDFASFILRLTLGVVFFAHGAQKLFGWFGGYGLSGSLNYFTQTMGLPLVVGALVIAVEFLGCIALVVGFLTRLAAFGIFCDMAGAIYLVHWKNGFFMNWGGNLPGEGYEFHLLVLAIAFALMIRGGGMAALDRLLSARTRG